MKTATYTLTNGERRAVEYDETAPCRICSLPVVEASMGGTDVCPWCDMGVYRDGSRWVTKMTADGIVPVFPEMRDLWSVLSPEPDDHTWVSVPRDGPTGNDPE